MTYLISSLLAFFAGNSRDRSVEKKLKSSLVNKKLVAFLTLLVAFTSSFVYAQPANDNCSGAILLNCGTTGLAGSTVGAVLETTPGPLSTASGMGVWYYFVGDGTPTVISSTGTGGFDHEMIIYSGSCGSLTYITNLDVGLDNGTETYSFTSTIGVNYYVYVSYWLSGDISTTGTFTVSLSCTGTPCTGTPNAGTATISSATGCTGQPFTLSATGLSGGAGLTTQWQSAPSASGPWTNITGGTTASFATSTSTVGQTFYRLVSTCSGVSSNSNVVSYTASACYIMSGSLTTVTACSGTFYDSGGPTGQTGNNETFTTTFFPSTPGAFVVLTFTSFSTENNFDGMMIYNGNNTGAPLFSSGLAAGFNATTAPTGSWYGTTSPGTITSTAADGSLTIVFRTDVSVLSTGWEATISCFNPTPCSGTPNAGTAAISLSSGCTGENFTLSATGLSGGTGLTTQWQSAPSASGPWTNITGGTTASFATSTSTVGQTFYRLVSTCSGVSSNSNVVSYTASACVLMPTTGVSYVTSCGTTVYDAGGASGNYANSSSGTVIIRPTSMDQIITATGTYATESGIDFLSLDEGEDSNPNTIITEYSGTGTITPFSTSGPGIPLVVHFTSDASTVNSGFALTISCACAKPTAITLSTTDAPCGGTGSVTVNTVTAPDSKPWVMATFENDALPTLPWLPTAAPNAWISGNAAHFNGNNNQMRLTQAQNSQNGALVFQSYGENQAELLGFFDIWIDDNGIGDGSADGLSFSYGPNIATTPTAIYTPGGYESGVGEGVVISFDTYNSGVGVYPNCTGTNFRNIYLLYNNTVLACYSNADNTFYRGNQNLCTVYISPTGRLFLTVNVNGVDTDVFPGGILLPASYLTDNKSSWRAALAARTGGVNDRHRVDNINLYHFYDYEYSINGTTWQASPTFSGLTSGTYTMYVRFKGITSCSYTQSFTISAPIPSTAPTSISGNALICDGGSTTLTSVGGTLGSDAEDVWYEGACPTECYKQEWTTQPFASFNATTVNSVTNGVLNVTSTSNDPWINMTGLGSFDPTSCRYVNIRYRVTSGTAGNAEIFFFNTANPTATAGQTGFGTLISDNTWRTVSVDMWADPEYQTGGNITGWRFDWATANGVTMDIDFITLSNLPIVGTGPSITVTPTTNTTYFTQKQGPCNTTTCVSQLVTISANPVITITGSTTACNGTAVTLTAAGGGTYLWSTGETTAAISVTPAATTTYTVSVTLNGCTLSSTHTLTITDNITTTFTQITSQCQGSSGVTLPATSTNSPAITGTWSPATISTTTVGTTNYVFTPTAGVCATPFTMPIQVVSCAQIEPCNILVYQIGNNATATSSAPVTILEFPPNFTNTSTPAQITAPVTGSNVLTNVSGGATGNAVSILTGYMNTNNGFTAIPGYSDPDNTANIETSSDNERVNLINAAQSTTVINAINTYFGSSSIIRGAVPIDATRFYCFGAGPSTATSGIFYWDGAAFTQIYTDANCVNTNTTNNIRSIDIFNGQLYLLRRPATGVLGFLFAVGNGLPTTLSTLSSAIASYTNATNSVMSFSISPDGSTMYTTDNSNFTHQGITKWIKTANGNVFNRVVTANIVQNATNNTTPTSVGNPGSASANKYLGLAVDWNASPVKLYATSSTGNTTGGMFLVALTESAGIGANAATWPAASSVQYYSATTNCTGCKFTGVDFAPTITANLSTISACVGTPVTVTASAIQSAVAPLTYQWYKIPSPNTSYVDYFGSVAVTVTDGTGGTTATFTPSVAGTYFCEVIGASCAKYRTPPVVISTPPTVTATAGACSGSTATITVSATGAVAPYNVSWTGTSSGNPAGTEIASSGGTYDIPNLGSGTYTISVSSADGCVVTPAAVTISCGGCTNPTIDTQPADIIECVNAAQQLSVTASGTTLTYQWYSNTSASNTGGTLLTGETNATYTPPSGTAGTFYYYVIVNSSTCATTSNAVTVIVNATPSTPTISGTATFCTGGSTVLTSSEATGNQWYNSGVLMSGETGTTLTVTAAGTYTVIATVGGCPSAVSAGTTVTVTATPSTPTISGTATFCTGGSTVLTSSETTGNQWYNGGVLMSGETGTTLTVTTAGTYTVIATVGGCPSAVSAGTTVTVTATPSTPTISGTATFCTGGSTVLTSSEATGNQWYNGGVLMSGETGTTLTVTAAGTYTVIATVGGCPSAVSAGTTVTVNPNPTAVITGSTTYCTGGTTSLTATGGGTYNWSNSLGTNATVSVGTAGSYTVTVTLNGCTAQSNVTVSAVSCNNFGEFASAVYVQTCSANNLTNNYYNTTGSVVNQISATAYQSTNFGSYFQNSGQLKLQGGEMKTWKNNPGNVCGVTLYYRIYPSLSAPSGAFSSITLPFYQNCSSGSFPSGGPCGGSDQKWQRPGNSNPLANIDLTTYAPDTYVLEIYYDIQGSNVSNSTCETTLAVNNGGANFISNFTIVAPPTASNTGDYCAGETIELNTSSGGTAYNWSGPNTYSNSTQNPTISSATTAMGGTYTVTVSLANNCTTTAQTVVVVNANPTVDVTCSNICPGGTTTVSATPNPTGTYTYAWTVPSGAAAQGTSVTSFSTGITGTYSAIITNTSTNCVSLSDGCTISIQAQPSVIFLSPP